MITTEQIKDYFIRVNNRNNFLMKEIPLLHPESFSYTKYWAKQKKRCIEGFWSIDNAKVDVYHNAFNSDYQLDELYKDKNDYDGMWRYMPSNLYFYVNHGTILHKLDTDPPTSPKRKMKPHLRDLDWEMSYNWFECRGFSGFSDDKEFNCNRDLKKLLTGEIQSIKDPNCFKTNGDPKQFVPAREYLRKLHNKPLGRPLYYNQAKNLMLMGSRDLGKAVSIDSEVHLPTGRKKIDDLQIGESIYGRDGKLTKVTGKYYQGIRPRYKMTFADKREVICDEDHLWTLYKNNKLVTLTTKEILSKNWKVPNVKSGGYSYYYSLPKIDPVQYPEKELIIPPYVLGALLGDGTMTTLTPKIATDDYEVVEKFKELLPWAEIKRDWSNNNYTIVRGQLGNIWGEKNNSHNPMTHILREQGLNNLCAGKFIPDEYKYSSYEQRLELVRGLLDTDGSINKYGSIEYCGICERLIDDLADVLRSLGIRCQKGIADRIGEVQNMPQGNTHTVTNLCYRLYIRTELDIFHINRKKNRIKPTFGYQRPSLIDIQKVDDGETVCITVDNEDHLFLVNDYVPTHNSYFVGVGVILHEFLFDGAKEYTDETIKNPFQVEIFVGAAESGKSSDLLKKTFDAFHNLTGEYKNSSEYYPAPFYKIISGTLAPNNAKNAFRHEYKKKINGDEKTFGSLSSIKHGIFASDNLEAAAGTRPSIIIVEETGLLSQALQVHGSNSAAMMIGEWKFGSSFNIGTGGNIEKVQESEIMFRDPEGFDFLSFDDIFEGGSKIGFFVPVIYGPEKYKDENGNTNLELALKDQFKKRDEKKKSADPSAINMYMMNYPLVPSEMFLNATGAMFPQAMIKEHLAEILANPHKYHNASMFGDFTFDTKGQVKWIATDDHDLFDDWPIKNNKDKPGVVQIWEMPKKDVSGNVFKGRYGQGTDTYDDDESSTLSLGSTFIMDFWTDRVVCEFTGRPKSTEFYEKTRMMCLFYGAEHNYENNKKGLFNWYDRKNSLHLLCDTPLYLKGQMDITIHKEGNKSKGTDGNKQVNAHALSSQLDWMLEPAYGEDPNSGILNLHKIRSVGYLKECLSFNKDGNFDRISAMGMLCILRNQKIKFIHQVQQERVKDLSKDPFFDRNYKQHNKQRLR